MTDESNTLNTPFEPVPFRWQMWCLSTVEENPEARVMVEFMMPTGVTCLFFNVEVGQHFIEKFGEALKAAAETDRAIAQRKQEDKVWSEEGFEDRMRGKPMDAAERLYRAKEGLVEGIHVIGLEPPEPPEGTEEGGSA